MWIRPCLPLAATIVLVTALPVAGQGLPVEPRTAAAVIAADEAWGEAEARGDAAYVARLLLPEYRSVGPSGKVTSRDAIVSGARARAGSSKAAEEIAAWKAAHPLRGDVAMFGDTAVLTWVSLKPASGEPISSCDVFVYRDGHWHAIYSQHSTASA